MFPSAQEDKRINFPTETSLSMMVDIHVLLHLVLFPWLSLKKNETHEQKVLKNNISLLLRLVNHNSICLYANQSTITDCMKYISLKYAKNQNTIIGDLFDIVDIVPSHIDNNEQILREACQLYLDNNDLSFDESLLLKTAQKMGLSMILTGSQKLLKLDSDFLSNDLQIFDISQLIEWIQENDQFSDIINNENTISVLTPSNEKKYLPIGATPVDFAYHIHNDVGNSYHKAMVNKKEVEPNYLLQNGDQVNIFRQNEFQPDLTWLQFVVTTKAKKSIQRWYRNFYREKGQALLLESFPNQQLTLNGDIFKYILYHVNHKNLVKRQLHHPEEVYELLGSGELDIEKIKDIIKGFTDSLNRMANFNAEFLTESDNPPVLPLNSQLPNHWKSYHLCRCCIPFPDQLNILGVPLDNDQCLKIHADNCSELLSKPQDQKIILRWNTQYCTVALKIRMKARRFILNSLLTKLSTKNFNYDVRSVSPISPSSPSQKPLAVSIIHVLIHSKYDLDRLVYEIEEISDVQSVKIKGIYP